MKKISLTQGKVAIVDDVDYDELSKYKWCAAKGYGGDFSATRGIKRNGKRHQIRMHRQILGLEHRDSRQTDHRNHNTLDNRRDNIRICTSQQNNRNRQSDSSTTSQFKGVSWDKQKKKWRASIHINGKTKHLGRFVKEEDAALAYNEAAKKYFGEFACLNLV